jgi:hypothetical protein
VGGLGDAILVMMLTRPLFWRCGAAAATDVIAERSVRVARAAGSSGPALLLDRRRGHVAVVTGVGVER